MRTGQARVARYRDIQQTLFDESLVDDFCVGEQPDACDRQVVRVVYGSPRLASASDDSGSFCSSEFNASPAAAIDEFVTADVRCQQAPETVVVATARPHAPVLTKAPTVAAPAAVRFESAVSTHPRFEVAADAGPETPFAWRGFALGLAAGTAAGVLLLAVFCSW